MGRFFIWEKGGCSLERFGRQGVLDKAKEFNVKFIRLQFTDILGAFKNIAITVEDLERALNGQIMFDSSAVEGFVSNRKNDIYLYPDPSTFEIFPWRPRDGAVARLICDVVNPDGTPYPECSRNVLKRVLAEAADMGYKIQLGSRVEFYLLHTDEKGNPTTETHDRAGLCDLTPLDLGENARRDMVLTLEEMGFGIGSSYHEMGHGQQEIAMKPDFALSSADKLVTFKFVVRTIAQRHGLYASFMPKPIAEMPGSSLNWSVFLYRNGANAFYDAEEPLQLSKEVMGFIGGMLAKARANALITNPLVNSYKRLADGNFAPAQLAWSEHNRNSIIRVVRQGQETRIDVRNPDPACNPYLALAVMIKAGMEGIIQGIQPPAPMEDELDQTNNCCPAVQGVTRLPGHLQEALQELANDRLLRSTLGENIYQRFVEIKRQEWDRYQNTIHPWELMEYLSVY